MQLMSSLQLEAYNYIKNLILSHKLDANTLYSETKLSKELGISRTPMREALQCLSQDGYITVIPSKGFRIRQLSQKDMKETIQIRCAIEGFCTQCLADEYNTPKGQRTIEKLGEILDKQKEAINLDDDYESFINYDHEFHLLLVNYIENEEINHMFQRLMYLIRLTTQSALQVDGRSIGTVDEHEEYFEKLKAGDGNEAYQHLMAELAYVPPESIGNTVRHYKERLSSFSRPAERTYSSLDERYRAILRSKNRIQEWEDEHQTIGTQISGKENMRRYEQELADIRVRLRDIHAKKDRLNRDDGALKSDIDRWKKLYDSLTAVSEKNRQAMELIVYAEEIKGWLEETYKDKELTIREDLEAKVNEIFERMYHGHRRVTIDAKYHVELLTTVYDREIAAGESEGSNRVKNFAFIAGLVGMAKGKIITDSSENGINLSSEPYPLVMDAPFSNADETHTANISKVLPEIAEQVIMFVMQKDWNYAEPVMNDRVGKRYHLNKDSETCTHIN